jgi:hypothetical protein
MESKAPKDIKNHLRKLDLKDLKPGEWISPDLMEQEHWTGVKRYGIDYCGRLAEAMKFIEKYFREDAAETYKVLCVQKDYGVSITIGAEASKILAHRAANALAQVKKAYEKTHTHVDVRAMNPAEKRRHEQRQRWLELQVEYQEHARVKHIEEVSVKNNQNGKASSETQTVRVTL